MKVLVGIVLVAALLVAGGVATSAILDQLHGAEPTIFHIVGFGISGGIALTAGSGLFTRRAS